MNASSVCADTAGLSGVAEVSARLCFAARGVAEADAQLAVADRALAEATRAADKARERIASLGSDRAAIIARRAGGVHELDDGPRLALIAADTDGLGAVVAELAAVEAAAREARQAALFGMQNARQLLEVAENADWVEALTAYLNRTGDLMFRALLELRRVAPDGRFPWGPGQELRDELRRASVLRGEL